MADAIPTGKCPACKRELAMMLMPLGTLPSHVDDLGRDCAFRGQYVYPDVRFTASLHQETERWWQAFCIGRIAGKPQEVAEVRAEFADAAIAEAKKRGRV